MISSDDALSDEHCCMAMAARMVLRYAVSLGLWPFYVKIGDKPYNIGNADDVATMVGACGSSARSR